MGPVTNSGCFRAAESLPDAASSGRRASDRRRVSDRTARRVIVMAAHCWLLGSAPLPALAQDYPPTAYGLRTGTPGELQRDDVLGFYVGASVSHDSNLFRVSGLVQGPQSDTIGTGYVGLRVDQPYAQQRIRLDAAVTAYRYDRFSYLDFNALDYRAAWDWHLTPRISGSLSADRRETPTQFENQVGFQSNVRTTENYRFDVDGLITGGWHVIAGLGHGSSQGETTVAQSEPTYRQDVVDAGARYVFKSGTSAAMLWRRSKGTQDDRFQNGIIVPVSENYVQDDVEFRGTWLVSAKSTLSGRVTYLDRRYDQAPLRDFAGTAGAFSYRWRPTSTFDVRFSATRVIAPWQSLFSAYRTRNAFSLIPGWRPTTKTRLSIGLRRTYDDYPTAVSGLPDRKDTTDDALLSAEWSPTRSLSITASVFREVRSSNFALEGYNTTVGQIGARFDF